MSLGFKFSNAEGAENRTRKLEKIAEAVEALQGEDATTDSAITLLDLRVDALEAVTNVDYEITEQSTGIQWVDGSIIYQKTIPIGTIGATGLVSIPHGVTGLNLIAHHEGYVILADGTKVPLPRVANNPTTRGIFFYEWDGTNLQGYVGTDYVTTLAIASGYITISYTKTV